MRKENSKLREFMEKSTFEVVFASYRTKYLKNVEKYIRKALELKNIDFTIDYDAKVMTVSTNTKTRDPYIIVKASDYITLLASGCTAEVGLKTLEDDVFCEIIDIKRLIKDEKVRNRRYKRIQNPKVLQALKLLTQCDIVLSNRAVCIVGPYKGVNEAYDIAKLNFENKHPAYMIKELITKKKLLEEGVEGDWDRYLPKVKKRNIKSKKNTKKNAKEEESSSEGVIDESDFEGKIEK